MSERFIAYSFLISMIWESSGPVEIRVMGTADIVLGGF